jgi:hypothetical protein
MMRLDENDANIANKLMFIQSVETILDRAGKHPGLDTVALEKARNAVRRSLAQEIMAYKNASDRGQYSAAVSRSVSFEIKFKPMA